MSAAVNKHARSNAAIQFVARTHEHMPECCLCDTTDPKDLKDAVAVVFRPNDPPMLAQVFCRGCVNRMALTGSPAARRAQLRGRRVRIDRQVRARARARDT